MWPFYWHLKLFFSAPRSGISKARRLKKVREEGRRRARERERDRRQKRRRAAHTTDCLFCSQLRRRILMHRAMSRFVASVALCVLISLACLQLHSKLPRSLPLSLSLFLYLFLSLRSRVFKRLNRSACVRVCFLFLILMSSGYVFVMHWGIPLQ